MREGFETTFTFRLSGASLRCSVMDDVSTHCRARGADGFTFAVQSAAPDALGHEGAGLGYDGVPSSLAVEFDTHYNPELLEPYENHVAVHARGGRAGARRANSANHSHALASAVHGVGDLAEGEHVARVTYTPRLEADALFSGAFEASAHSAAFLAAHRSGGGSPDWLDGGIGALSVYVDDLLSPVLVTPLNLAGTLDLHNHGRAWVGFTAGTGFATWQVHDILEWKFRSTRQDPVDAPPPVVNG